MAKNHEEREDTVVPGDISPPPQIPKFSLSNSQGGHKNTILGHSGPNPAACLSPGTAPLPAGGFSQRVLVWGRMDEQPE